MTDINRPIDIVVTTQKRTKQLLVSKRPDLKKEILPNSLDGYRWAANETEWTIPFLSAHQLLPYFRQNHSELRVSFDKDSANLIHEQLSKENSSALLSSADDGDFPDVLNLTLRNFQRACGAWLMKGTPRRVVALDTGLGKTAVMLSYARMRKTRTLVVTSASLINNMKKEIKKLTDQSAIFLSGGLYPSANDIEILSDPSYQFVVISYDTLARSLLTERGDHGILSYSSLWALAIQASGFGLLVVDEAHNIKNRETARWKSISLIKSIPSVLLLTATPFVNNGLDMFSLLTLLDPETFSSPTEFVRAFLTPDGKRVRNENQMREALLPYVFRRKKTDVLKDLPPKIRQTHEIELTGMWASRYALVMKGLYKDLKGNAFEVSPIVLAKINRFRQVVSQAKVEHSVEKARELEEAGEKVIIFTKWKETAEEIAKELYCSYIHGDIGQDERTKIQDDFQTNSRTKFLVTTLDTGQAGLNLTAASAIIFNDYDWTPKSHEQAEGRAWGRLNDIHGCLIFYICVANSIDSMMMDILKRKQSLIDSGIDDQYTRTQAETSMVKEFLDMVREYKE